MRDAAALRAAALPPARTFEQLGPRDRLRLSQLWQQSAFNAAPAFLHVDASGCIHRALLDERDLAVHRLCRTVAYDEAAMTALSCDVLVIGSGRPERPSPRPSRALGFVRHTGREGRTTVPSSSTRASWI